MAFSPSTLGGSNGKAPIIFGSMDGGNERALARKYLSKAFGNMNNSGLNSSPLLYERNILGPFRTAFNAGDVITNSIVDTNSKYGTESNQVGGNNLSRLQRRGDGKSGQNGTAMYSGNTKYVHAGSDYIRFKKLQALNKTYNDRSFGGAENSQHQIAIYRVRK
jgi:hypothetical protein